MVQQSHAAHRAELLGRPCLPKPAALSGRQKDCSPDHAAASAMNASTALNALSSGICSGGCLQKYAAGARIGPPRPRSRAILAQRIISIATPAELWLYSTDRRSSRSSGTPPNIRPSIRRQQTSTEEHTSDPPPLM